MFSAIHLAVVLILMMQALGQTSDDTTKTIRIVGRVSDRAGTSIPDAKVTLRVGSQTIATACTGQEGEFAFSAILPKLWELRVETDRFREVRTELPIQTTEGELDIGTVVMPGAMRKVSIIFRPIRSLSASELESETRRALAKLPPGFLTVIGHDLGAPDVQSCLEDRKLRLEQTIGTEWMSLNTADGRTLIVRGLGIVQGVGTCLGGVNNGPFLGYSEIGSGWRKIFDGTGARLNRLPNTSRGWHDLELWQHDSAFRSIRYVYRFSGTKYEAIRCNVVQFTDFDTDKQLAKPIYTSCDWDWKHD